MTRLLLQLRIVIGLGGLLVGLAASAAAAQGAGDRVDVIGVRVTDTAGRQHRIGVSEGTPRPAVLVFLDTACPVATRYVPTLNELHTRARRNGATLYGVLSNPAITWRDGADFAAYFNVRFPVILDSSGDLALRLGPRVTSESFLISTANRIVYRGRINDRFADIGRQRPRVTSHDLRNAMDAVARGGRFEPRETEAVGCFHHTWNDLADAGAADHDVTYSRQVAPLLAANCTECHRQSGIAPFSLDGYQNAMRWSRMIAHVTSERLMPPWRAVHGFGEFRDARNLSAHQIGLLRIWSENGAPLGDPENAMPVSAGSRSKWRLGQPDLALRMPESFDVPADGDDIYRYFVIPTGLTQDQTVVALDFSPGDPRVVHHANYLLDTQQRARAEDAKDAEPGFSVFGTGGFLDYNAWGIGGWTPGADPWVSGGERGIWFPEGADLVLEVHYHPNGRATSDRSEIAVYFAKEPVSEYLDGLVVGTQDLTIPPGNDNYWRRFSMSVPAGITLTDITPHMHFLGREFISIATLPDGREIPLIRIADWDFRWQNTFSYLKPVHLSANSRIDTWVRYDNSAENPQNPTLPPRTVTWGWETGDEMSELWIGFVPDAQRDRDRIVRASERSWYESAWVGPEEITQLLARLSEFAESDTVR